MSDLMRQTPFGQLMDWALGEYKSNNSVFGVTKLFKKSIKNRLKIFGESLELPFGPAAGPHTQLAQNLIAGYAAGARFFELKTVQILDGEDLPVSKPCILANDEGYNVEWSTELYVPQALDEYVKGWFAIKLLSRELGLGSDNGFVFNMSVGYDLEGIKTNKIDSFIEGLRNAEDTDYWKTCKQWALDNLSRFTRVDKHFVDSLRPQISNSITLSTLHGCPPEEIERIASYLLKEKGMHTFIKCNPTLLGYECARQTLDSLGYDYISFDDHHFKSDLQFEDAVPMLGRLRKLADSLTLEFGVKLTNTFPVKITENELPGEEMYMSGRSLFPLSIEVANRLSKAFDGKLRISFSGGADFRNIADVLDAGIWPVTMATTVLKPGGYLRFYQIAEKLRSVGKTGSNTVDLKKLQSLADMTLTADMYRKPTCLPHKRKMKDKVPLIDCFTAPCRDGCPFGQDIPAYLRLAGEGKYLEALRVIMERNSLPFITGTICAHNCMNKCTRTFYENSVDIRAVKLAAAENAYKQLLKEIPNIKKTGGKVAVVGGGPAGLSAAYFLARAGRPVTIFEKRSSLGGIVRFIIPEFRISIEKVDKDISLVQATGVEVRLNCEVKDLETLRTEGFEQIIIATGAWRPSELTLDSGEAIDALAFLEQAKNNPESVKIGKNAAVIGGGNTAMDTARAAKRIPGVENVNIVYRRTKRYMPADSEEYELAVKDGVILNELLEPKSLKDGYLLCDQMKLGAPDESGRRSPVKSGESVKIPADSVILAVGNKADTKGFAVDAEDVYVIGDAARGPATIAEAIKDAAECAGKISGICFEKYVDQNISVDLKSAKGKKGILYCGKTDAHEPERCLECVTVCENCVDVCPNRANVSINVDGRPQIIHIDFLCNECGNCEAFCPYESAPYLDKFTFYIYDEDFNNSENDGFLPMGDGSILVRLDGEVSNHRDAAELPADIWALMEAWISKMNRWFM